MTEARLRRGRLRLAAADRLLPTHNHARAHAHARTNARAMYSRLAAAAPAHVRVGEPLHPTPLTRLYIIETVYI